MPKATSSTWSTTHEEGGQDTRAPVAGENPEGARLRDDEPSACVLPGAHPGGRTGSDPQGSQAIADDAVDVRAGTVTFRGTAGLDDVQRSAVEACCDATKRIVAVTGEAGTGKTTILKYAYEALVRSGYRVALCAPTGKAAKRIREATGIPAKTIHMLLEYTHPGERNPKTGEYFGYSFPRRDNTNPLPFDFVFADEYAMVTWEMHGALMAALPRKIVHGKEVLPTGSIRMFGDAHQLPPIEKDKSLLSKPSPFETMLKKFPSFELLTQYRQGEGSGILENGRRIMVGRAPQSMADCRIYVTDNPIAALSRYVDKRYMTTEYQVITPSNKTWVGTLALNGMLQNMLRDRDPSLGWISLPRHKWVKSEVVVAPGDKVIITNNDYDLGVFNGESGIITAIEQGETLVIDLGDRVVKIPPEIEKRNQYGRMYFIDPRRDIDLAYAITTHKAQGSEYKEVVYVLNRSTCYGQNRRNFYTGITRAREKAIVLSDMASMHMSIRKRGK